MLYYIDTNGLYNIRKIDQLKVRSCITSVMAILELVSGISPKSFNKRKAILSMVLSSGIAIDYAFPEEIVFNSFDAFDEYEFVESREKPLTDLVKSIIKANDYEMYVSSNEYNSEFGHEFFKTIDDDLSKNFYNASKNIVDVIKHYRESPSRENIFKFQDIDFDLNTKSGLKNTLPLFSRAATILGMATLAIRHAVTDMTEEGILPSFNGLSGIYVDVFSRYCDDLLITSNLPSRNDAMDLLHLIYLKDDLKRFIVSDDGIFKKYFPDNTLPLNAIFS